MDELLRKTAIEHAKAAYDLFKFDFEFAGVRYEIRPTVQSFSIPARGCSKWRIDASKWRIDAFQLIHEDDRGFKMYSEEIKVR